MIVNSLLLLLLAQSPLPLDEILTRMKQADQNRLSRFTGYTGTRNYSINTPRIGLKASMKVDVQVLPTGVKQFKIISMTGPGALRKLVFQRMLDTESKASQPESQSTTKINQDNYDFKFVETRSENNRNVYVLAAEPRTGNPLLFRGNISVDAEHFAITRLEGSPAKKPSMWVESTRFVHEYVPVGEHWFASSNRSQTNVRVFGKAEVLIEYNDYKLAP